MLYFCRIAKEEAGDAEGSRAVEETAATAVATIVVIEAGQCKDLLRLLHVLPEGGCSGRLLLLRLGGTVG